jgi:hypothetical protein
MSSVATSTLPEDSSWYQAKPLRTSDQNAMAGLYTAIVLRELNRPGGEGTSTELPSSARTVTPMLQPQHRAAAAVDHIFTPALKAPELSLQPLQEWEGYVTEIGPEKFSARLVDRTAGNTTESEIAEFPVADVADDDKLLLIVGGVFRWIIGYQRSRGGTKRRVSQVTFRRLPAWSANELKEAEAAAKVLTGTLVWD